MDYVALGDLPGRNIRTKTCATVPVVQGALAVRARLSSRMSAGGSAVDGEYVPESRGHTADGTVSSSMAEDGLRDGGRICPCAPSYF